MAKGDKLYHQALKLASQKKYNHLEVIVLLTKAIDKYHNSKAAYALATWYLFGKHVRKNYVKAFQSYLLASFYGNSKAKYEVGRCFYYGFGVLKDTEFGYEITTLFSVPPTIKNM